MLITTNYLIHNLLFVLHPSRSVSKIVGVKKAHPEADLAPNALYIDYISGMCLITHCNIFLKSAVSNHNCSTWAFFQQAVLRFLFQYRDDRKYVFSNIVYIHNTSKAGWTTLRFITSLGWEKFFFMYQAFFTLRYEDFLSYIDTT